MRVRKQSLYRRCVNSSEKIICKNSFWDKSLKESVNTLSMPMLIILVVRDLGEVDEDAVRMYLEGVVLSDTRGRGIMQRVVHVPETGWMR